MKVHTYKGKGQSIYLGLVRNLDLFLLLFNSENEDRAHFSQEATLGKIHFRCFIVKKTKFYSCLLLFWFSVHVWHEWMD